MGNGVVGAGRAMAGGNRESEHKQNDCHMVRTSLGFLEYLEQEVVFL